MPKTKNSNKRSDTSQKRRETLMLAAIECFVSKGFHQTSIRDIAQTAGVSLGNLYNHFANKEALIISIAEIEAQELSTYEALFNSNTSPKHIIQQFIERYVQESSQIVNATLMVEITAEAMRNSAVAEQFDNNRRTLTQALQKVIEKGVNSGEFDPEINQAEAAELILDAIEGASARAVLQQQKLSIETRQALCQHMLKMLAK